MNVLIKPNLVESHFQKYSNFSISFNLDRTYILLNRFSINKLIESVSKFKSYELIIRKNCSKLFFQLFKIISKDFLKSAERF